MKFETVSRGDTVAIADLNSGRLNETLVDESDVFDR